MPDGQYISTGCRVDNHAALPFMPGRVGSFALRQSAKEGRLSGHAVPAKWELSNLLSTSCFMPRIGGKKRPDAEIVSLHPPRGYYNSDIGHHNAEGFRLNDG